MTCYHPNTAFQSITTNTAGKRPVYFGKCRNYRDSTIQLPCGQCIGCRLEYSRQWAVRAVHESKLYQSNCFLTLTYNDENLPWDRSLNPGDFQKFIKRFRNHFRYRKINPETGRLKTYYSKKIRYYHSGEYGKATPENDFIARPHYHALIFNHDFTDRKLFSSKEGIDLYTSDTLDNLWTHGFTTVGELTFESAAYVARYIMKKINGEKQDDYYTTCSEVTGELINLHPEYSTMSRAKGIGQAWFKKYKTDCYPSDSISVRGNKQRPPKYYDYLLELTDSSTYDSIKEKRLISMEKNAPDNTPARLATREIIKTQQIQLLNRNLNHYET